MCVCACVCVCVCARERCSIVRAQLLRVTNFSNFCHLFESHLRGGLGTCVCWCVCVCVSACACACVHMGESEFMCVCEREKGSTTRALLDHRALFLEYRTKIGLFC